MSFPRQASVAAKMAMAWGIIADICEDRSLPMVQATPQRIKKVICPNVKGASKEAVQRAVVKIHPNAGAMIDKLKKGDWEHAADALAVLLVCEDSEVMRMARSFA